MRPLTVIPACFKPESRDFDFQFSEKTWIPYKTVMPHQGRDTFKYEKKTDLIVTTSIIFEMKNIRE
jgi:hypothetical protein